MSKELVKFSPEWFAAKKQARKDLDYKLSLGLSHADKSVVAPAEAEAATGEVAPRAPKVAKAPKVA